MSRLNPAPNVAGAARDAAIAAQMRRAAQQPAARPPTPPMSRQNSHDSASSSGSSHSSHSSHQEREREQHLGESAGGPPSVARGISAAIGILLILFVGQAGGLWLFTRGFLLTRTTLDGVAQCSRPAQQSWTSPRPSSASLQSDAEMKAWETTLLSNAECTLPPTFSRTFLWIIDALRYDFIADTGLRNTSSNASHWSSNPHYHDVLSLPAELDKDPKSFSILTHFLADAPTTTLQRLKGLTTGSLPTFIDAGSNFGGSEITEDNWLSQLRSRASATPGQSAQMGMAGDETWLTVFPDMFDKAWRYPFDSFNVEDLDSVDHGVASRVETFLDGRDASLADWRLLVAHTLGVDHVGHRLGASHPRMREKLLEMQTFLRKTLDRLPDDTLFVLMGDHGMDERGDHGGDGELEVGAALWMYAKRRRAVQTLTDTDLEYVLQPSQTVFGSHQTFSPLPSPPFDDRGHRSVAQIDFVPTISLLLGLPIAFNNLGSVIPEAFDSADRLLRALRINAIQIKTYMDAYAQTSNDLRSYQDDLTAAWQTALRKDFELASASSRKASSKQLELDTARAYMYFNRLALSHARSVWARFDMLKMVVGLCIVALSIGALFSVKKAAPQADVEALFFQVLSLAGRGGAVGGALSLTAKLLSLFALPTSPTHMLPIILESALAGGTIGALGNVVIRSPRSSGTPRDWSYLGLALPLIHAAAFSSNSFILHEDKIVLGLTAITFVYRAVQGYVSSPSTRLKGRIPYLAVIAITALRLASYSRVCREEHGKSCIATFYADSNSTLSSPYALIGSYLIALGMPTLIEKALATSRSNTGIAPFFLTWVLRPTLLCGSGYWIVDWVMTSGVVDAKEGTAAYAALEWTKLAVARFDFAILGIIGLAIWIFSPLCLELTQEAPVGAAAAARPGEQGAARPQQTIAILGFANSFGSSYVLFVSLLFAAHYLLAQPMGQVALGFVLVAMLASLELGDAERDAALLQRAAIRAPPATTAQQPSRSALQGKRGTTAGNSEPPQAPAATPSSALPVSMLETSSLALIGFIAFFATGHQATFVSIQWRTAFVGFRTLQYPFAPLFVIINSFGPLALLPAVVVALLVLWNLAPKPRRGPQAQADSSEKSSEETEDDSRMPTTMHILQASLSFLLYFTIILFASAAFAAHFRRHLMLFKVWVPRFMLSAASLQLVYVGLIIGLVAAGNVMSKVAVTFGSHM